MDEIVRRFLERINKVPVVSSILLNQSFVVCLFDAELRAPFCYLISNGNGKLQLASKTTEDLPEVKITGTREVIGKTLTYEVDPGLLIADGTLEVEGRHELVNVLAAVVGAGVL